MSITVVSDWIEDQENEGCFMRVLADSNPLLIENRVAFIEKTPRVRIHLYTERDDYKNWKIGRKGSGEELGRYEPSRE